MDLTLRQLRMLREVAVRGTLAAAATSLGYTASAASQQIAALERATGQSVLERVGRGVQLTDAGHALAAHAEEVFAGIEHAQAALEAIGDEPTGTVRISTFESFASALMPEVVTRLAAECPGVTLRSTQLDPDLSLESLLAGAIDIALVLDYPHAPSPRPRGAHRETVLTEPFRLAVPDHHRLTAPVDLTTLTDEMFIAGTAESSCRRCVVGACREAGFEPRVAHEIDNLPATLRLVAAGAGITLLPELALHDRPPGIRLLEITQPVQRSVEVAYREASSKRPTVRAVLDAIIDATSRAELTAA